MSFTSLSQGAILALACRHDLVLDSASLQIYESGLDFQGAIAQTKKGASWLLRIPRRLDVLASVQREWDILTLVRPHLPVQVPNWQICTNELIAYPLLAGKPAGTIDPELQAYRWEIDAQHLPHTYLRSLGDALAALHNIQHQAVAKVGLKTPSITEIRTTWSERIARVKEAYSVNPKLSNRWQRWLDNDTLWPEHTTLIHGDLHPGHILIDCQGQVTGLIDWSEARVDDLALDFTAHYQIFGRTSLETLIGYYEQRGGRVWPTLGDHIVEADHASVVDLVEFAERSGLEEFKAMARQRLSGKETGFS